MLMLFNEKKLRTTFRSVPSLGICSNIVVFLYNDFILPF